MASVCEHYRRRAAAVVDDWDGVSTAELILLLLRATGEDVRETLEEARYKWDHDLLPPEGKADAQ